MDATHDGHSNCYLFLHKGFHHVLKPMIESDIKVEVFAPVKMKYQTATIKPKLRTTLLQGEENDVTVLGMQIPAGSSETPCKDANGSSIKIGSTTIILNDKNGNTVVENKCKQTDIFSKPG